MNDPALKQVYKNRCKARQNAYAKAIQDFYVAPEIREIDLSNYTGGANSFIRVYATDDFRVNEVEVRIEDEQNLTLGVASRYVELKASLRTCKTKAKYNNMNR